MGYHAFRSSVGNEYHTSVYRAYLSFNTFFNSEYVLLTLSTLEVGNKYLLDPHNKLLKY